MLSHRALISLLAALGLLLPGLAARAQSDRPVIEIAPGGARAFRVAVQRFKDAALPQNSNRADDLRSAIGEGLTWNGVLLPIADEAFLGPVDTDEMTVGRRFDCGDWTQSGADALVEGRIDRLGQRLVVEFAVWDTARCRKLARFELSRLPADGPLLARLVADKIVEAFTGTSGSAATEIAFISTRTGEREVFVMNADGSRARAATRSRTIKAFPDWMADGGGIVYTAHRDLKQPALFLTARNRSVRPGPILDDFMPERPKYRGVFDPAGDSLAVVTSMEGAAELFLVSKNGGMPRRLTNNPAIDISPTFSPDGSQIAFVSDRSGSPQIYVMNRDGSDVRRLTFQGSYNTAPSWSPDGRWIAYETRLESQFDIWLIDPTGDVNLPLIQHRRSDESPTWSPDGRKVAFSSSRRGRYDIYVQDVGGGDATRLTTDAGENKQPVWGPFPR